MKDNPAGGHHGIADHDRVGRAPDEMRDERIGHDPEPQHEPPVPIRLRAAPRTGREERGAGERLLVLGGEHSAANWHLGGKCLGRTPNAHEYEQQRRRTRHWRLTTTRSLVTAPKNPTPPVILPRSWPNGSRSRRKLKGSAT